MEKPELEADSRVDDDDLIHIGNIEFKVIATPGHTKGGLCLYSEKEKTTIQFKVGLILLLLIGGSANGMSKVFEEIGNAITHGLGALFAIFAFVMMLLNSAS